MNYLGFVDIHYFYISLLFNLIRNGHLTQLHTAIIFFELLDASIDLDKSKFSQASWIFIFRSCKLSGGMRYTSCYCIPQIPYSKGLRSGEFGGQSSFVKKPTFSDFRNSEILVAVCLRAESCCKWRLCFRQVGTTMGAKISLRYRSSFRVSPCLKKTRSVYKSCYFCPDHQFSTEFIPLSNSILVERLIRAFFNVNPIILAV